MRAKSKKSGANPVTRLYSEFRKFVRDSGENDEPPFHIRLFSDGSGRVIKSEFGRSVEENTVILFSTPSEGARKLASLNNNKAYDTRTP
jgi:hypothetical protein